MPKRVVESSLNRDTLEQELRRELDAAQARYDGASTEFDRIISEVSGSLPSPGVTFQIQKAASTRQMAFENYMEAMKRFSDFTLGRSPGEP